MLIAIIEDDVDQSRMLSIWLEAAGHVPSIFGTAETFLEKNTIDDFDILILDWDLPGIDGIELLRIIREDKKLNTTVLFATRHESKTDIVTVLEAGADDYMVKPVDRRELLARLNTLKRRKSDDVAPVSSQIIAGEFKLDDKTHRLTRHGEILELTPKEYELVSYLFTNLEQVLSRADLLSHVWGCDADINTRTVDTHISRIRKKLSLTPENGWKLESIYHYGYRLEQINDTETEAV
ncbi:MAG: response regulator transcription factor [Gammaproteobacteria bacterium]|nr:response regulator transcription factor [Gammaproteobacteria bacterium]